MYPVTITAPGVTGQVPLKKSAAKGVEMHVVEKGETLRGISQRYGVRVKDLCKMNGLTNPDMIRANDILRLRK